jgi:hypothetical protein
MVCKLAQVPPEIWNSLSLEAKKWLFNERKRQQIEDDKLKKSSNSVNRDTTKSSSIETRNLGPNSSMPNQNARVKNAVKGEEEIHDQPPTYGFIHEFLEDAIKSSNLYEEQDTDYEPWNPEHNIYTGISRNSTLHNKCRSLLFLPQKHQVNMQDGDADTCILGKGWNILSVHNSRRVKDVGFVHETDLKRNLPIVGATTVVDLPKGKSILLVIYESIHNGTHQIIHCCQSSNLENMTFRLILLDKDKEVLRELQ